MSIIKEKADAIQAALIARGMLASGNMVEVKQVIEEALRTGGSYRLLEQGSELKTVAQVKDRSGTVIGEQG